MLIIATIIEVLALKDVSVMSVSYVKGLKGYVKGLKGFTLGEYGQTRNTCTQQPLAHPFQYISREYK